MFTKPLHSNLSAFSFISIHSRILDAQHRPVNRIRPSFEYLHGIELGKNYSLTPAEIVVRNIIATQQQISYAETKAPGTWEFEACLFPNRSFPEQYGLLRCLKKLSGKDEIATEIELNGHCRDNFTTDIDIE